MKTPKIAFLSLLLAATPGLLLAESASDQKIEDAVQSSYTFRTVLQGRVKVEAKDGVATLTGSVQSQDQKELAEDTARAVNGVDRVDNQISIESNQPANSDGWIEFKIHTALLVRANVSTSDTHVAVKDGVVTLTGTADSLAEKALTEAYVKDIDGVRSVENNIEVKEQASAPSPTLGDRIDDASITAQVKYELLTNRATSAMRTKVTTSDGVVEISGSAVNPAERDLVTKIAQSIRGVKSVTNNMTVAGQ